MIRALVVDDSAFMRRAVSKMLDSHAGIEVVDTAKNGKDGLAKAKLIRPDIITMDIEMPEMDGLTALRHIMSQCPTPVLMLSSLTTEGSRAALTALQLGASDFLAKDMSQVSLTIDTIRDDLVERVLAITAGKKQVVRPIAKSDDIDLTSPPIFRSSEFDLICIGSSTGGPPVLEKILPKLPETLSAPIVVAQHMPKIFTESMSERLNEQCQLRVIHAEDGMAIERKTIYIAPGGQHTHIVKKGLAKWALAINDDPKDAHYRPSVDALFYSAAKATGRRTLGIVLTGIGQDGMHGGRALHDLGAPIIAQSSETCVVYGMPKAVTENALIRASLSPEQIAESLLSLASGATRKAG